MEPAIWHTAPMADTGRPDGTDDDGPSLEMPSFSLRRTRRSAPEPAADESTAAAEPVRPAAAAREEPAGPRPRRELPTLALPGALPGAPAAAVTGVAVGGLAVLLAWLAASTCDVVRGTSSCGGGPGLLVLATVLVLLAYAGSLLLRVLGVRDAGSTSVLAVGILAVLVLVFLLGSIDEWWMVIAVPVAGLVAFSAAWWVTTSVVGDEEPAEEPVR